MKFIVDNWALICLILVSGVLLAWPWLQNLRTAGLTAAAAVQLINHQKAVVVDVREPAEFALGCIPSSKNVPMDVLSVKLTTVVKSKNVPLILVCQTGIRSGRALTITRQLGYSEARSLGGGLLEWKKAHLPLVKV